MLPVQGYLCPVASQDLAPAEPFVTVGYDAFLGWSDGILALEKTAQAQFLIEEWRACLLARNDVTDSEQEDLLARIEEVHSDAVAVLRSMGSAEKSGFQHVLGQHSEVFTQLGIKTGGRGQGKGHSASIRCTNHVVPAKAWRAETLLRGGARAEQRSASTSAATGPRGRAAARAR